MTTPAKPAAPLSKALAQAKPQAPAQAPLWPPAPVQPVRQAPAYYPQPQAAPPRGLDVCLQNLSTDEDRLSDFPESESSLIAKQVRSEYLDRMAAYCELERGDPEEQRRVMGIQLLLYHDPSRASINMALLWHSVAEEIADLNLKRVNGHNV